jgi:hypothetical protein
MSELEPVVLPPTLSELAPVESMAVDDVAPTSLLPRLRKKAYKFSCRWLLPADPVD